MTILRRRQNLSKDVWLVPAAVLLCAAVTYMAADRNQLGLMVALVVGGLMLLRQPTASIVLLLIVAQELASGTGQYADNYPLLALGHQLYFINVARLPAIELVAVIAAGLALARSPKMEGAVKKVAIAVAIVGLLLFMLAWGSGMGLASSLGSPIKPAVLALAGVVLAATVSGQRGGWSRVAAFACVGFYVEAMIGVYALATGRAPNATTVFYDSALPALAGAVLIALFLAGKRLGLTRLRVWFYGAAPVLIVVLSGRRNVWAAMAAIVLLAIMLRSQRLPTVLRGVVIIVVLGGVASLTSPGVLTSVVHHGEQAWATLSGTGAEAATTAHITDLRLGLMYARSGPFWGYGYTHSSLPGLAVEGHLYVHNEYLLAWLRFGIPGLFLSACTALLALNVTFRKLQSNDLHAFSGAVFVWMAPVCCMTAPFLSTTARWPLIFGLAIGAALSAKVIPPRGERTPSEAQMVQRVS